MSTEYIHKQKNIKKYSGSNVWILYFIDNMVPDINLFTVMYRMI